MKRRLSLARIVVFATTALLAAASPAFAQRPYGQGPDISVRLFGMVSDQQFAAQDTFNALFGSSWGLFWGAGVEVLLPHRIFADIAVSRFSKTGQRAFVSNGQVFGLGIPLTAAVTPVELTAGYRLKLKRLPVTPYVGVGVGTYRYQETSDFSDPSDSIDTRNFGLLAMAGAEVRVSSWASVSADVQDTRVTGILGTGGVSQQFNENNLGGLAVRFRILVGQ